MEPLDLEIDSHFGSLATAKGDGLAKLPLRSCWHVRGSETCKGKRE